MNRDSKGSSRILCFAGHFDDGVIEEMERYAGARAYRIDTGSLLLCRRKPMGQGIIDRAISFGWQVQPLPRKTPMPKIAVNMSVAKKLHVFQPPAPPSRLTHAERKTLARRFVQSVDRGDWKKPSRS